MVLLGLTFGNQKVAKTVEYSVIMITGVAQSEELIFLVFSEIKLKNLQKLIPGGH
jgi:hypothetical protein